MGRRGRLSLLDYTLYFVTTTVTEFTPVFSNAACCDILINNIRFYRQKYHFKVHAYVIMPTHFHWIVEVDPTTAILSTVMREVKKYSAWDIMDYLKAEGRSEYLRIFSRAAHKTKDQQRKLWIKRFDDAFIRNDAMFESRVNYIHLNPVKAGLVARPEDYKYSSARNYLFGDHSVLEVVVGGEEFRR
jgi:REP element-mobilizing transposase RayT